MCQSQNVVNSVTVALLRHPYANKLHMRCRSSLSFAGGHLRALALAIFLLEYIYTWCHNRCIVFVVVGGVV